MQSWSEPVFQPVRDARRLWEKTQAQLTLTVDEITEDTPPLSNGRSGTSIQGRAAASSQEKE